MVRKVRKEQTAPIILLLIALSIACRSVTIIIEKNSPFSEPAAPAQQIGFNYSDQIPELPKGDTSARWHLFLHEYPMPSNGFITGVIFVNDSDKAVETFDFLVLRPNDDGWKVIYRMSVSDDNPPSQTGTTTINFPSPLRVQKNDIFAHWQDNPNGAIPLNTDDQTTDGFSIGQYGFQSSTVEVGRQIDVNGFSGHRDYFINVVFSTNP